MFECFLDQQGINAALAVSVCALPLLLLSFSQDKAKEFIEFEGSRRLASHERALGCLSVCVCARTLRHLQTSFLVEMVAEPIALLVCLAKSNSIASE